MSSKQRPYWIDDLDHKHECYSYGDAKEIVIDCGGKLARVIVPEWMSGVTPLAVTESEAGLMMVVGQLEKEWDGKPLGVMLVAKKRSADEYEVGVWHELYPWALKHLGLVPGTKSNGRKE